MKDKAKNSLHSFMFNSLGLDLKQYGFAELSK